MNDKDFAKKNSETSELAWDEVANIHKRYRYDHLIEGFSKPGFISMPNIRRSLLEQSGVKGKAVFQPCCNNGRDILSILNMGAERGLGIDISSEFLSHARDFAHAGNLNCEFVQADIYELGDSYDNQFDVGVISLGSFMWMRDLPQFFSVMAGLLRNHGKLIIHEFHPIGEVISLEPKTRQLRFNTSYFAENPKVWDSGLDYFGGQEYEATPCYRFLHKISDVIMAASRNSFVIERFDELEEDMMSGVYKINSRFPLPRSYTMVMRLVEK